MGRGLSELQKRILATVYECRRKDLEASEGKRYFGTSHAKVIAALYDWPIHNWIARGASDGLRASEGGEAHGFVHNFRLHEIGEAEYNRKTASYYRAVSRLRQRGLVHQLGNPGRQVLVTTDKGIREAEKLSVRSGDRAGITSNR